MNDKYHFWNEVYGFKMSSMKREFKEEGKTEYLTADCLVSNAVTVKSIDIGGTSVPDLDFKSSFRLEISQNSTIHGLIGWFDIFFDHPNEHCDKVFFSTAPGIYTHWKQTIFLFEESISAEKGTIIEGEFDCRKHDKNHRELVVNVRYTITSPGGGVEPERSQLFYVK
jgi:hypothetical protein